jgi:nucleotide-binding universal stress UspA family protein
MHDRILVPLDASPRAEQILAQVARLLRREDAEVVLLHVSDPSHFLVPAGAATVLEKDRASSDKYLKEAAKTLESQGVRVRALMREGLVADTILRVATDVKATLIALSTHGRSGLARWVLGSVAEKVIRGAPVPVLLMRSFQAGPQGLPLPAGTGEFPFRRILVPVDGSKTSLQVLPAAADFASLFGAEVDVLSVDVPYPVPMGAELPPPPPKAGDSAREEAERAVARFLEKGVKARPLTSSGDPAARILDTATAERADLIAMATHGWTGVTRWMLGSVTEKVLRHSTLPMLIVRPARA